MKRLLLAFALLAVASLPAAASPIVDFTGGIPATTNLNTFGFGFSLTSTQSVGSLGIWDEESNGLATSHQVGLWNSAQTLLAVATVDNSSSPVASTSPNGRWMFTSLPGPLSIGPGTYFLGAYYPNQTDAFEFRILRHRPSPSPPSLG